MENLRNEENRKSEFHNNSTAGRNKNQAPVEFEGMNFELRRKPYQEDTRGQENTGSNTNLRKRD